MPNEAVKIITKGPERHVSIPTYQSQQVQQSPPGEQYSCG
jgi:hypothetical protein